MEEDLEVTLNEQLTGKVRSSNEYNSVWVLVIWWEDGDYPGFETEAGEVKRIFTDEYNFRVETFAIPSKKSQVALDHRIGQFILENDAERALLVVHYGGHGDEDDARYRERQSVWAA